MLKIQWLLSYFLDRINFEIRFFKVLKTSTASRRYHRLRNWILHKDDANARCPVRHIHEAKACGAGPEDEGQVEIVFMMLMLLLCGLDVTVLHAVCFTVGVWRPLVLAGFGTMIWTVKAKIVRNNVVPFCTIFPCIWPKCRTAARPLSQILVGCSGTMSGMQRSKAHKRWLPTVPSLLLQVGTVIEQAIDNCLLLRYLGVSTCQGVVHVWWQWACRKQLKYSSWQEVAHQGAYFAILAQSLRVICLKDTALYSHSLSYQPRSHAE